MVEGKPIKIMSNVIDLEESLRSNHEKAYVFFQIGINTGLFEDDIISLRVNDVKDTEHIRFRERKSRKEVSLVVNDELKEVLKNCTEGMKTNEYIFLSQDMDNDEQKDNIMNEIKDIAESIGIHDFGEETLRKTFGYHLYEQTRDISIIKEILHMNSVKATMCYLEISPEERTDYRKEINALLDQITDEDKLSDVYSLLQNYL